MPDDKRKNTASNLPDLDDDWVLPGEAQSERGSDKFIYVNPEEFIQEEVRKMADRATKNIDVTAEESLENGFAIFHDVARRESLPMEGKTIIIGGMDSIRDVSMAVERGKVADVRHNQQYRFNIHGVADAGDHSYNQDGLVIHYDDAYERLNIMMAHGPQFDPIAVNMTNAAAVRAGLELTKNPAVKQVHLLDRTGRNIESVAEELGESGKDVQLSSLQLTQTGDQNTFSLDVLNPGNNHCIIVDTNNGDVKVVENSDNVTKMQVKTGDIVILATDELVKAIQTFKKESQDLYLGNRFFIESQTGTSLKDICDGIIKDARENGLDCGVSIAAVRIPEGVNV